ncbi:MAG: PKD domain-containing protein, partial [Candidatus Bathyarchaeia archaeon]
MEVFESGLGSSATIIQPERIPLPRVYPDNRPWIEDAPGKYVSLVNGSSIYYAAEALEYDTRRPRNDIFILDKIDWIFVVPGPAKEAQYYIGRDRITFRIDKGGGLLDPDRLSDPLVQWATLLNGGAAALYALQLVVSIPVGPTILKDFVTAAQKVQLLTKIAKVLEAKDIFGAISAAIELFGDEGFRKVVFDLLADILRDKIKNAVELLKKAGEIIKNLTKVLTLPEKAVFLWDLLFAPSEAIYNVEEPKQLTYIPTVSITEISRTSVEAPSTVSFSCYAADIDGRIVKYEWDFGDGDSGHGESTYHTYQDAGTFLATVTVEDDDGSWATDTVTITVNPGNRPPTATILSPSNNSTFTQGDTITFRGQATDPEDGRLSGSSLVWTSSRDGMIGTGESFTKSDLSVGTHTITLTATDSKGATGQDSISITIKERKPHTPSRTRFTDFAGRDKSTYLIGDDIYVTVDDLDKNKDPNKMDSIINVIYIRNTRTGQRISVSATEKGVNTAVFCTDAIRSYGPGGSGDLLVQPGDVIEAIYTDPDDSNDRTTDTATIEGKVNQRPVAIIKASPTTGEAPLTVNFDGSSSYDPDGNIVSYNWSFGDGATGSGARLNHTYSSAGTYTATLTVTDNEGATGTDSITISVSRHVIIPTSLTIILDPSSIPENTDRTIKVYGLLTRKDTGQGIAGKKIDSLFSDWPKTAFTDSNGYYQTEYSVNLHSGSYEFSASFAGDSEYGASRATAMLTVTVKENKPPVACFSFSPPRPKVGETVIFDASCSYDPDGSIVEYIWLFPDREQPGLYAREIFDKPGTCTICLRVKDDKEAWNRTCQDVIVEVESNKPPVANFAWEPFVPIAGETVQFIDQSYDPDGIIVEWSWAFNDPGSSEGRSTKQNPTHVFNNSGTYNVCLVVGDNNGASDSICKDITVV